MRIGLIIELNGVPTETPGPTPRWPLILEDVRAAEAGGFDLVVFEDDLLLEYGGPALGSWESVSIAGAIAAATSTIDFGHSVVNSPYRSPAMLAKIALTLDEVSGGRYVFGLGAGNTPDSDYAAFGFPSDRRYSRFEDAIQIIHPLLKEGAVDYTGRYWSATNARTILPRQREGGPPIIIAGQGPKMLGLVAKFADGWNWYVAESPAVDQLAPVVAALEAACEVIGRDPATLTRSIDMYSFDPFAAETGSAPSFGGSTEEMIDAILSLREFGVGEVRCHLPRDGVDRRALIEAMQPVVEAVHSG